MADGTANDPVQQPSHGLKAVVIGLGVLLAICAAIVIGTIVYRLFNMPASETQMGEAVMGQTSVSQLPVPAGCTIDQVTANGDRMILLIGGSDACRRVLVADLKTGLLIREFHFSSE